MSLPSHILFYKDGKEVANIFCNIGWWDSDERIGHCIVRSIKLNDDVIDYSTSDEKEVYYEDNGKEVSIGGHQTGVVLLKRNVVKKQISPTLWEFTNLNGVTGEPMSTYEVHDIRKMDWDSLKLYGRMVLRKDLQLWADNKITDEEFISTFQRTT